MRIVTALLLALSSVVAWPASGQSQDRFCDCSKIVGACSATYELKNIRSDAKGMSYSGDLTLQSSSPTCSRVDYYVDNTPYFSLMGNTNTAAENIFGTSKFTAKTVSIERCRICARTDPNAAAAQPGTPPPQETGSADLSGQWSGAFTGPNAGPMQVSLQVADNGVSGTMVMDGKNFSIASGSVSGSQITIVQSFVMGNVRWSGTLSPDRRSIQGNWTHPFNGGTFQLSKR